MSLLAELSPLSDTIAIKITLLTELCVSAPTTRSRGVQFAQSPTLQHSITPSLHHSARPDSSTRATKLQSRILGLSIARPLELAQFDAMRLFLASLIGAVLANAPAVMACEGCKEPSSVAGNGGV